ncbi:methyltransferase domain-containing protein [Marispirochaeta aestuarii]|uniref:SAM-dependent methyltransferase n=1 Tax=Marispirochaeta aestuarii TaxID=1963862 RepID=UPI0029C685A3|nr:methyltransferase domain-containing protein [Marispirochaeta aestuarii]
MNKYPRTEKYESEWIEEYWMGPNPLQLTEELCTNMKLTSGMKVLDMGCGKGLTSIFLAKEFGVTVFANDLWIDPTENLERCNEAGVADKVFPIHAEAHALPYADGFFDAAIAVDSYHYFGTDEMYFPCTFSKLVKPGGQLGIICPGLMMEYEKGYPETHKSFWNEDMFSFHSAAWWKNLWEKTGIADITACYNIPDPKSLWYPWAHWAKKHLGFNDVEFLNADTGNQITIFALVAMKKNEYD